LNKTNGEQRSLDYWRQVDVMLPTQLNADAHVPGGPERRLRLAVLEDAVHELQRRANPIGRRERAQYEVELGWFMSNDRSDPFSFESICEALDMDPDLLRRRLCQSEDGARVRVPRFRRRVMSARRMGGEAASSSGR
jgi:hypothetical protein